VREGTLELAARLPEAMLSAGGSDYEVALATEVMLRVFANQDRFAEGLVKGQATREAVVNLQGESSEIALRLGRVIAEAMEAAGLSSEALLTFGEALSIATECFGREHWLTTNLEYDRVRVLAADQGPEVGLEEAVEVFRIYQLILPEQHDLLSNLRICISNMARQSQQVSTSEVDLAFSLLEDEIRVGESRELRHYARMELAYWLEASDPTRARMLLREVADDPEASVARKRDARDRLVLLGEADTL